MKRQKLTKSMIDEIGPVHRDVMLWDGDVAGFGLRLRPGGSRTFIAQYRVGGGRTGRIGKHTIGSYGTFTVDEARKLARKIIAAAIDGRDPSAERQAKRREATVTDLIAQYAAKGTDHMKERNRRMMLARLDHHVVPLLGRKKLSDVRVRDVEQFIRDVREGKTAKNVKAGPHARIIVKGGPGAAAKVVRDLSAVFTFAVRQELVASNPCSAVKKPADGKRTRFLTIEEVSRLGETLVAMEREGVSPKAIAIARLWVLTGCRRNEIAGLQWVEVDFERGCLRLMESKTGRSVRPLAASALAILGAIPRDPQSPYVFPSDDAATFYQGTKRFWPQVVKRANLPGVTPHTLRHTIGSAAVSTGETLAMTGALLGHADARSTSIYAHMQQDPARRAADRVVGPIATALGAQASADVIDLAQRKVIG
jgi:integrase